LNDEDAKVVSPLSAKSLKLGMKIAAKVYQIRALGLVLDLGNGVRGMYRFEVRIANDFELACIS
jgi:polyribonucleotide nucleotidyltransferase